MIFVGQSYTANNQRSGLSILFSAPLAAGQDWRELVKVSDAQGRRIDRDWLPSYNPRSIYMPGLPVGRYSVTIEPLVQGTQGQMLNVALRGPVLIR